MNNLTKIAALPGSGAGCMASLPAEKNETPIVFECVPILDFEWVSQPGGEAVLIQMMAPYFQEHDELAFPPIDLGEIGGLGA
jgi:hypothetical protein